MARSRPIVVSTRAKPEEAALIRAAAEAEALTVAELVHRLLLPAVRSRLSKLAADPSPPPQDGARTAGETGEMVGLRAELRQDRDSVGSQCTKEAEAPVVAARRVEGDRYDLLEILCPYCDRRHRHGAGPPGSSTGTGDGHRTSHCGSGYRNPGYFVREVRPEDAAAGEMLPGDEL